jgi:hypothetical protein
MDKNGFKNTNLKGLFNEVKTGIIRILGHGLNGFAEAKSRIKTDFCEFFDEVKTGIARICKLAYRA